MNTFEDMNSVEHVAKVQNLFHQKQFLVVFLCTIAFVSSQMDFSISSYIQEFTLNTEQKSQITQVVHLTQATFLILLGSILEYSPRADLYVFLISACLAICKVSQGFIYIYVDKQHSNDSFFLELNKFIPFEILFAITNSIKYTQVIYIAKWVNRSHLMTLMGFWFAVSGILKWVSYFTEDIQHSKIYIQFISGGVLLVVSYTQKKLCSLDPLDCDLIVNEQCLNLTSIYNLPKVKNVMMKSEFLKVISKQMDQKSQTSIHNKKSNQMQKIKKQEQMIQILSISKSVSFNDLIEIRNVKRIIAAAVFLTCNEMISKQVFKQAAGSPKNNLAKDELPVDPIYIDQINSSDEFKKFTKICNTDFMTGILIMIFGYFSSSSSLQGRRISLIVSMIGFLIIWNVIWISFNDIYDIEQKNKLNIHRDQSVFYLSQLMNDSSFDFIMFEGERLLSLAIYYNIIISGPIDISKMFMLRDNKRIFAILICFIGGIKLGLEGLLFDQVIRDLIMNEFIYERCISIIFLMFSISILFAIVKDELMEVFRAQNIENDSNQRMQLNPKDHSNYKDKSSNLYDKSLNKIGTVSQSISYARVETVKTKTVT